MPSEFTHLEEGRVAWTPQSAVYGEEITQQHFQNKSLNTLICWSKLRTN